MFICHNIVKRDYFFSAESVGEGEDYMTVEDLIKMLNTIPAPDMVKVKLEFQRSVGEQIITRKSDINSVELNLVEAILILK
jgi:hypothetical protein